MTATLIKAYERRFQTAIRSGWAEALLLWQRTIAPGHFTPGARFKYGYKPRSKSYEAKKKAIKGHNVPLVWSGDSRKTVKSRFATPQVTKKRATGNFEVALPIAVRLFGRSGELKVMTDAEKSKLVDYVQNYVNNEIEAIDKDIAEKKLDFRIKQAAKELERAEREAERKAEQKRKAHWKEVAKLEQESVRERAKIRKDLEKLTARMARDKAKRAAPKRKRKTA